jgi:hypothetical protein
MVTMGRFQPLALFFKNKKKIKNNASFAIFRPATLLSSVLATAGMLGIQTNFLQ